MKLVWSKRPLPTCFRRHVDTGGLLAEADIYPHPRGRLAAKLLVFDKPTNLRRFWRKVVGSDVGRECRGCVNALAQTREAVGVKNPKPPVLVGDPRYFCVIGLVRGWLSMEVISHEAVHAGYCYEKRVRRNLFGAIGDFDEERVAYPAGRIAGAMNEFLARKGLYLSKRK
jgi:hypothetical protein